MPGLTCSCRVSSLHHEVFDYPVEPGVVVVPSTGQFCEVRAGLWSVLPVQFHHYRPHPVTHRPSNYQHYRKSSMKLT